MEKEDIQVDIPENKDVKEEEAVENKAEERSTRKREQVEDLFVKHYGVEKDSVALKKLVDREMASAKSFDKLIKQKKKWRSEAQEKKDTQEKKTDPDKKVKKDEKNSFERIRDIEKTKATQIFLQGLIKKYPETFKTKSDVMEAYDKIEKEYKESGDETRREDFKQNLKKAFRLSHPDLYEAEIREKTRKELLEDDIDLSDVTNKAKGEKSHKNKPKFFKPKPKKENIADWLIKGKDN